MNYFNTLAQPVLTEMDKEKLHYVEFPFNANFSINATDYFPVMQSEFNDGFLASANKLKRFVIEASAGMSNLFRVNFANSPDCKHRPCVGDRHSTTLKEWGEIYLPSLDATVGTFYSCIDGVQSFHLMTKIIFVCLT